MCSASCLSFPLTLEPAEPMRSSKLSSFAWVAYGGAITPKKWTQSPVEQPEQRVVSLRAPDIASERVQLAHRLGA